MANRNWRKDRGALEQGLIDLYCTVSFGATGAPTLDTTNSKGIKSITRDSAGDYTILLGDAIAGDGYMGLKFAEAMWDTSGASGAVPNSPHMYVKAKSPSASGGGTVEVVFCASSGASGALVATDPASGDAAIIHLLMKNSTV